jgi:hypothetical protein
MLISWLVTLKSIFLAQTSLLDFISCTSTEKRPLDFRIQEVNDMMSGICFKIIRKRRGGLSTDEAKLALE